MTNSKFRLHFRWVEKELDCYLAWYAEAEGAKIKKFPWLGRFGDNIISDIEKFPPLAKSGLRTPQALHFSFFPRPTFDFQRATFNISASSLGSHLAKNGLSARLNNVSAATKWIRLQSTDYSYRLGFSSNGPLPYVLGLPVPTWHEESTCELFAFAGWGLGLVLKFNPHVKFTSVQGRRKIFY